MFRTTPPGRRADSGSPWSPTRAAPGAAPARGDAQNPAPRDSRRQRRLGQLLCAAGLLRRDDLAAALREQRRRPQRRLGALLTARGAISPADLQQVLAAKLRIPRIDLTATPPAAAALRRLPAAVAQRLRALPVALDGGTLQVAMSDPFDDQAVATLAFYSGCHVRPLLADAAPLERGLRRYALLQQTDRAERALAALGGAPAAPARAAGRVGGPAPISQLLDALLVQASEARASDINIRPGGGHANGEAEVYFRTDGRQRLQRVLPVRLLAPLLNRLKIIGGMDIANRRVPQDGQATLRVGGRDVDLRISVLPTINGESASVRVLDKSTGFRPLSQIGFRACDLRRLRRLLARGGGLLLVTGPTGAGKSTTLYALLDELRRQEPHIITLEEPVEYRMEGVEQLAIRNAAGLTFARALRNVLRHDPDVILVGEIRDAETAQIATRAALTGHLVLSSLHTFDAASAVTRLLDLDVESHLLGSTLLGVIAQRLLALNCRHCLGASNEAEGAPQREAPDGGEIGAASGTRIGRGCERCDHSGVRGRAVAYELLPVGPDIRRLLHGRHDAYALRRQAITGGMRPLVDHARELVRRGDVAADALAQLAAE